VELLLLLLLLRERLDHVHADDVLLGDVATSAIFCWTSRAPGARPWSSGTRAGRRRRDRERDEREPPVRPEHDRGDADDREHVLEEEDEAVAEEEAHRLQVDRCLDISCPVWFRS
jgi:hypothetical protein